MVKLQQGDSTMDKFTNLLVDQQSNTYIEAKLTNLLALVRKHLDMDVAVISEFINDERIFKVVDNPSENQIVKVAMPIQLMKRIAKKSPMKSLVQLLLIPKQTQ